MRPPTLLILPTLLGALGAAAWPWSPSQWGSTLTTVTTSISSSASSTATTDTASTASSGSGTGSSTGASSASTGSSDSGSTKFTYNIYGGAVGSCGSAISDADDATAYSPSSGSVTCGEVITITIGGVTATATILDTGGPAGGFDLTPSLFAKFAPTASGTVYGSWSTAASS